MQKMKKVKLCKKDSSNILFVLMEILEESLLLSK